MTDHQSGPYCRHWVELGMGCDELCVCGHTCDKHFWGEDCEECDCEKFVDLIKEG